jgi:hypothetical protein
MANLLRLAKSGNDWTNNDLRAYNIDIREQDQHLFFGGPLPECSGPVSFIEYEDRVQGLDAPSLILVKCLDLAMKVLEGEESAVVYFATELLRVMGYETDYSRTHAKKYLTIYV